MSFLEFLRENDALCKENLVQPHLGAWVKKYLLTYPLEARPARR